MPLQPGEVVENRYQVVRAIGCGAKGPVFEVQHLGLQTRHCLKVLHPALTDDQDARARFMEDGRIQARLHHRHVVSVTDVVVSPVLGLISEFMDGPSVGGLLQMRGFEPLALGEVTEIFLAVLEAIGVTHARRLLHLDLKPGNILLGRYDGGELRPAVTDFGIADLAAGEVDSEDDPTASNTMAETLAYWSPELIQRTGAIDERSDVFSLGAILYAMCTGRTAFGGVDAHDTMTAVLQGNYTSPDLVVETMPPDLAVCIRRALAVDPAERFQSCADFYRAMEDGTWVDGADQPSEVPQLEDMEAAVAVIVEMYEREDRPPPPVSFLDSLVRERRLGYLKAEMHNIWSDLLKFHQRKDTYISHEVTEQFQVIQALVVRLPDA